LTTVHSADQAESRTTHPGVLHLLRWRALEQGIGERCTELDLGGVDVAGARRIPLKGEPTFGLYEHKHSFGAEWLELAGAHEYVARPLRYLGGRLSTAMQRLARRAGFGS
jgi:lipid II:glycine glycyltransferase (peptidoglycan interpeptide bridge formation enzyme)